MEFFCFDSVDEDGYISSGRALNGIRTAMWVERYRDTGEFTFKAPVSSNLRTLLPVGSLISHIDTLEVMMVESHEIDDDVKDNEPEIEIRGSSLESYLKQRSVGDDIETYVFDGHRLVVTNDPYELAFGTSWEQVKTIIEHHLNDNFNIPNDHVPGFVTISDQQHIGPSTAEARIIRKGNLHDAVLDLLAIDDFGIRVHRPNAASVTPGTTEFRIHNGTDRTEDVIFSYTLGDLENAQYFWSDKALKTDYHCVATYSQLRSDSAITGFPRRIMYVDCTDIDGHLAEDDIPTFMEAVGDAMDVRGQMLLRSQVSRSILSTNVSKNTNYQFRTDYFVGDLVTVNGNYDTSAIMRVTEHVEFQDENGESGYPTLSALNE